MSPIAIVKAVIAAILTEGPKPFTCPACGASHARGWFQAPTLYRCMRCGYVGHGHHPDAEIDAEVHAEILGGMAWDIEHGFPAGPVLP